MIIPPIVSYLMAETFSISGFLALMWCAFLQSMYAQMNLEVERSNLLLNAFKALSYTFRSICDILVGVSFAIHAGEYRDMSPWILLLTLFIISQVSFGSSFLVIKKLEKHALVRGPLESTVLIIQNNTRGLLGFTLALQNFNSKISAIALLYIVFNSLLLEPAMNFVLTRRLAQ